MGIGDWLMSIKEIREQLAKYLANEISIDTFEDWVAQNTWNIHQSGDEAAQRIAYAIESRLAEYSGGFVTEPILRNALAPLVTSYEPEVQQFGSSNLIVEVAIPMAVAWAPGTTHVTELAS
jgi:hypothetical protein